MSSIMRASFLKGMTEEERKYVPLNIARARIVPVTHEQKQFMGFDIDNRGQTRDMEECDGKRS
eukprot:1677285-Alexandrium_andersonii.AAC.1